MGRLLRLRLEPRFWVLGMFPIVFRACTTSCLVHDSQSDAFDVAVSMCRVLGRTSTPREPPPRAHFQRAVLLSKRHHKLVGDAGPAVDRDVAKDGASAKAQGQRDRGPKIRHDGGQIQVKKDVRCMCTYSTRQAV